MKYLRLLKTKIEMYHLKIFCQTKFCILRRILFWFACIRKICNLGKWISSQVAIKQQIVIVWKTKFHLKKWDIQQQITRQNIQQLAFMSFKICAKMLDLVTVIAAHTKNFIFIILYIRQCFRNFKFVVEGFLLKRRTATGRYKNQGLNLKY